LRSHLVTRLIASQWAGTLVDRLPTTLSLLEGGEITYLHAKKLAEWCCRSTRRDRGDQERVLRRAADQTVGSSPRRCAEP